jgi:hypothetical protein
MKYISGISILFFLITSCEKTSKEGCFPDKGIKTAITIAKIESDRTEVGIREIKFDKDGRPLLIRNNNNGNSEHKREYLNGKLNFIITTRKELPSFYSEDEFNTLIENANEYTDTAVIISHSEDGRPLEMKGTDGFTCFFKYTGCEKELITTINPKGDTIQQVYSTKKGGVLLEQTCMFYAPKSRSSTKYYGYMFNEQGHWIKRKYKRGKEVVTERRKLTYY